MSRKTEIFLTIVGDALCFAFAFFIAWKASEINQSVLSLHALVGNLIAIAYWLFLFQTFDLYEIRTRIQLINETFKVIQVIFLGFLIILAAAFVLSIDFINARGFIPSYLIMMGVVIAWRFFWRGLFGEYKKPAREKVLIFQNGDRIDNYKNFNVVEKIKLSSVNPTIPASILDYGGVDGVVIESGGNKPGQILKIISQLAATRFEIYVSPKLYPLVYQYFLVQKVSESPFLKVIFHPLSTWDRFLKRIIDITLAILGLLLFGPVMLFTVLMIKLDSQGPVLYRQKRVGFRGRIFTLLKFRSMVTDAEKHTGPVWARKNDRRITRLGAIMRPLRIDELPQLFNVLEGQMSFIGPRPERPAFVEQLTEGIPLYNLRLNVYPGITGLAQVKHRYDRSIEDVKNKLEYDLEYINNMSLRLDLKIFFKTILTVLKALTRTVNRTRSSARKPIHDTRYTIHD